ncbi:MAG: TonB-dependent receptor [Acidobacteriota bacterium]
MRVRSVALAVLFLSLACARGVALAQSGANSGQIVGHVLDSSGAAVPNANVSVRHTETNYRRDVTTDTAGRYAVSQVPLGRYEVGATVVGFEGQSQEVLVTLGSTISANFQLVVGARNEAVQVRGDALTLEPTQAASKSILTALQIQHLPSNGGRLQSLVWDTPGGQIEPECRGLSVAGQKGIFANISIDGGDYNSTFACGTGSIRGGSGAAPTFNQDALEEFQITRNIFAAEFGRTTGGVINMSTKSGTNEFHDSASYLVRNEHLSARDVFGNRPLTGNQQYGGTFGGPLRQDRTFFFIAPLIQAASKPVRVTYPVLDQQSLRGTSAAQALLAVAPEQSVDAIDDAQSVIGRVDHNLSSRHMLLGRFDFSHTRALSVTGSNGLSTGPSITSVTTSAVSNQSVVDVWAGTALVQLTSALSNTRLNEFRVGFGREERPRAAEGTGPQVAVQNAGATIATYGPQGTGISFGNGQFPSVDNRYQLADNFSIVNGAHTAKFGVDFVRISSHVTFAPGGNGVYTFSSLSNLLARVPQSYTQFTGSGQLPTTINELSLFAQDEWRVLPNLTISPGFRYDAQFNPRYLTATLPQDRAPGATEIPDDLRQFQPRVGLAWTLGADNKTVVRTGGGMYYAPTVMSTYIQSILFNGGNPELGYSVSTTNAPALASAFQSVGVNLSQAPLNSLPVFTPDQYYQLLGGPVSRIGLNTNYIDPGFRNPRATQWKVGVDREIASGITTGVDYTYINTTNIARQRDVNLGEPVPDATGRLIYPTTRPLGPLFGINQITESSAQALYRALTTTVNVRRPRYIFSAFYTLSWNESESDTERPVANIVYESAANLRNDYNWSNLDMRHQLVSTNVFFLPGDVQLASTERFASGRPFNATAGSDLNRDGQTGTDRPAIAGSVIQRNTFRNAAFYNVDLRIERSFDLPRQKGRIVASVDFFNVFNFDNVLIGSANMVYGAGTTIQNGTVVSVPPPANFGQLRDSQGNYLTTNTPGDPFQAQVGLRWVF